MEVVSIIYNGTGQSYQNYKEIDENLITTNYITPTFGLSTDYVEFFVYDEVETLLSSTYGITSYTPYNIDPKTGLATAISVNPELDAKNEGFDRGTLQVQYNFLRQLFNSSRVAQYWIKEISPSRTEIKLASQDISDIAIETGFSQYQASTSTRNYYNDFYLNFGNNTLVLGVNAAYTEDDAGAYLLVKLYEPLPFDFDLKSTLWIVEKAAESVGYEVDIQIPVEAQISEFALRGPNYNIRVNSTLGQTTPYYNYTSLFSSEISSSMQQLKSWYEDKAIQINVDYTNFKNFIHFSSATERVNNFVYKLGLIESYNKQIVDLRGYSGGSGTTQVTSASISSLQNNINRLVEKFDVYEYYLYFSSESFAWPKYNNTKPYIQVSVTSSQASNWLGSANTIPTSTTASLLFSASYYDAENQDRLNNSIPKYLVDDPSNEPYLTFLDMIGQHFDNIWLYYKDVSNRFEAQNNPNKGISKDMVANALRSMGMEIYTNSTISNSVYFSLFGVNPDGSLLPPTGSERITNTVTSSLETLASNEIEKEVYKRLYHNLPYLLKSKGTERGIKALLACYGIPEEILSVNEYGGYNRYSKAGLQDEYSDKISYTTSSLHISSSLLHPNSTLQHYSNDTVINSTNIEVAFSPSDKFDSHIIANVPNLRIENLIGSPGYMYSSSYNALVLKSEEYFRSNYVTRFNVWDYIRLVKYFNNSVFKMIKDFVPARSNVTTGIVLKDHLLHRNKYARHEPEVDIDNNYSESIDTAFIIGGPLNDISGSTEKSGYHTSSIGYIPYTTTDGVEKYTGEFDGTEITVSTLNSFNPQFEYSQGANINLGLLTQSISATYNNVSQSARSIRFFDLDYSYQQNVPVNINLINYAISKAESNDPQWDILTKDPNVPFAYLQDYNYATNAFTIPRYYGSKVQSSKFTYYVDGETGSLGSTAAIDKQKYQYAYLVDIYTASLNLPGRSNSQIKYIIDNDQNVLDLTKANKNVFYTQNIFKSGESIDISLFDYDPRNPDVQFLSNKKDLQIYEGGFRYSPVLYSINGANCLKYKIDPPEKITATTTTSYPAYDGYAASTQYKVSSFEVYKILEQVVNGVPCVGVFVRTTPPVAATVDAYVELFATDTNGNTETVITKMPTGDASFVAYFYNIQYDGRGSEPQVEVVSVYKLNTVPAGSTTTTNTTYITEIEDCTMGTNDGVFVPYQVPNANNYGRIWLSVKQSQPGYYSKIIQTGVNYETMETPVFPIVFALGDVVKLKDQRAASTPGTQPESTWWPETEEYRVVNTELTFDDNGNTRIQLNLDRPVNPSTLDNWNDADKFPSPVSYFIFNKHVPDETNIILRYAPVSNITQDGIVYPEYIIEKVRDQAGNTIKSLKSQNLI